MPKHSDAYPIPCDEWRLLREEIEKLDDPTDWYHTFGAALVSACLAALIALVTVIEADSGAGGLTMEAVTVMFIAGLTGIVGWVCLLFSRKRCKLMKVTAAGVLSKMNLIEKRYSQGR